MPGSTETCPDCGIVLPAGPTEKHAYLGASPACWALYGKLLAREYNDPSYMAVHRITVDAYCAQHPGQAERRTIHSINVHLTGLYLTIARQLSGDFARRVIAALVQNHANRLRWLPPPPSLGKITVADVARAADADQHAQAVREWGQTVWDAWHPHHAEVARLADEAAATL